MAINIMRGRVLRRGRPEPETPAAGAPADLAIGAAEDNTRILSCPACARPLDRSFGRCPGCGTTLVHGVQARRASAFVLVGASIGLIVGVTGTSALGAAGGARATARATGAVAQQPASSAGPSGSSVPTVARSALTQSAAINARLSDRVRELQSLLAIDPFDTGASAQALRAIAADAAFGVDLAPRLGRWSAGRELSGQLGEFYVAVRSTAHQGIDALLADAAAYRRASRDMVELFRRLPSLDAASRSLAGTIDLTLPSVTPPSAAAVSIEVAGSLAT
ncbi:MAG TPA: hypothetical protein VIV06_01385 [Candidatus Limnocylindrales bacterium]